MNRSLLILALLVAMPAHAQQAAKPAAQKPPAGQAAGSPDAVFDAWDKNKDGVLSKDEFNAGWALARGEVAIQRLHAEFQRRDTNKSDKLEANEFATLMIVQRAGKNAPQLSTFDKDKDNALDFPEYLEFVRVTVQSAPPQPAPAAKP